MRDTLAEVLQDQLHNHSGGAGGVDKLGLMETLNALERAALPACGWVMGGTAPQEAIKAATRQYL